MPKNQTYSRKSELKFGKWKGYTIEDVLELDPSYLVWAHNTISWFKVTKSVFDEASEKATQKSIERYNSRINDSFRRAISPYIEDSPYWFEDDNGSWLT